MTPAVIIDGAKHAAELTAGTCERAKRFHQCFGRQPRLDVIIVGDDPASRSYVTSKTKQAAAAGIDGRLHQLPASVDQTTLLSSIRRLSADDEVDGILVQLPLPRRIDANAVIGEVDPAKDVDGFHPLNAGRLISARTIQPEKLIIPCTPLGAWLMLEKTVGTDWLRGKTAVVVGRSNIVGKPMAHLLLAADCTVTLAHSHTANLPALCRTADVLVAAVGSPEMIKGSWIKPGAVVIDVGINRVPVALGKTRIVGDVATQEAIDIARFISPVPGGVGRMTVACLLLNTVMAAERRAGLPVSQHERETCE